MGVGIILYLGLVSFQSLIFSFRYSVYSFCAVGVLVLGELPSLAGSATLASYVTPMTKAYTYGLVSFGGIMCFINISWNPLLLFGHLLIGFLAYRNLAAGKEGSG